MTIRCPKCEAELEVHRLLDGSIEVVNHFYCTEIPKGNRKQEITLKGERGIGKTRRIVDSTMLDEIKQLPETILHSTFRKGGVFIIDEN